MKKTHRNLNSQHYDKEQLMLFLKLEVATFFFIPDVEMEDTIRYWKSAKEWEAQDSSLQECELYHDAERISNLALAGSVA